MANLSQVNMSTNILEGSYSDEQLRSLQLFEGYPKTLLHFTAVCCMMFMMIGIPGNLVTIFALALCKKVRNVTAIFIINLSVADLLNCCINLPFAASTFWTQSWPHGELACKIFPSFRYALAAVSLLTVLAITVNRYVMISHPTSYHRLYTTRNLIIMIVCIWSISWLSLLATWLEKWGRFGMNTNTYICDILPSSDGTSPMTTFFLLAFVVPCLTIIICYSRIFWIVKKANKKSHDKINNNRRSVINESSFETSTAAEQSCGSDSNTGQCVSPEHPRVESLRTQITGNSPRVKNSHKNNMASMAHNIRQSMYITKLKITKNLKPTKKDKRLLSMITAIIVSFLICHLPITILKVSTAVTHKSPTALLWSYILRFLTTCINPVIYVVMSQKYRKAYKKVFRMSSRDLCCRCWR